MNRVHEQCPKIDSGTVLSPTVLSAPSAQPIGPASRPSRAPVPVPRAPARPSLLAARPSRSYSARAPSARAPVPPTCVPSARAARQHADRAQALAPSLCLCRGLPMAVSWPGRLAVSRYSLASQACNTLFVLQLNSSQTSHLSHDTNFVS